MLKTTLSNGLSVIVEENHASPVVAAQVWVRVGSADELEPEAGLAHVHEHMLFKGTERRKVGEIAAHVEAAGGDINAWTSFDQTVYHVTIASREWDVALDILADAVQHSTFQADELERELEVVLEELRRGNDTPSRVASELLFKTAYQAHPYRRPIIGYVDTVKSFTREGILDFYRKWYRPQNMCLVVVGDISAAEVERQAEQLFEARPANGDASRAARVNEPMQDGLRVVSRAQEIQETYLNFAWHGTRLADDDTAALDVMSILLGAGESSRLYSQVKRKAQLVNDCYASSYTPQDRGLLGIGAQVQGERVEQAYKALLEQTQRLRYEAPSAAEVDKAKTIILSDAVYSKETMQGMARSLGYFEVVAGSTDFEQLYYDRIKAVTTQDVLEVAQRYLDPQTQTVATLHPSSVEGQMSTDAVVSITEQVKQELEGQALLAPKTQAAAPTRSAPTNQEEDEGERPEYELGALQVAKVRLQNGATLLVMEDDSAPLVSIRAASKGGLLTETQATSGVSHLVGELLVRGSERYSAEQIIEECDTMAGGLTGVSGRNSLGLRGVFLKDSWERGFELFASSLLEPQFLWSELEKERKTQLEDLNARADSLSTIALDQLALALYKDHPYGLPSIGQKDSLTSLARQDVVRAYRDQLRPDALTIAVVGAVDVAQTIDWVQRRIGVAKPHADARPFEMPAAPVAPSGLQYSTTLRDKEQAHMVLGFMGITLDDPRKYALDVLCSVLGGQSGRLFMELRDRQSLAYSVSAFSLEGLHPGYFGVYIGTSPDKLGTAERGIRTELRKIRDEPISAEELERAQRYLIGAHAIGLQRASARSTTMALNEAYGMGYDDHAKHEERVQAVTANDVQEVAQQIIRFERAARSVVRSGAVGQQ